jgi:hypothetical protein
MGNNPIFISHNNDQIMYRDTDGNPLAFLLPTSFLNATPPSIIADSFCLYATDAATGNSCPTFKTENGNEIKLYRQSHIADPSGGATQDAEARSAINTILTRLETLGLLATS